MIDRFEGDFPKLSKSNSLVADGMIFYFKKHEGSYIAWEYKSKVKIVATDKKERIKTWLILKAKDIRSRLSELDS